MARLRSLRRRVSMLSLVATTAAILVLELSSVAQAACSATAKQLTWSCGGVCDSYIPCLVYDASDASCSDCTPDSAGDCAYQCFDSFYTASDTAGTGNVNFLIPFGSYESDEEKEARADGVDVDAEVAAFTNDTVTYPSASNDELTSIADADLRSDLNYLTIWGGSSADYSEFVRGKVVNVALDDDFVAGFDNLSVVNLYNMNLANVTDLPDKIPEKAWRMSLRNDLLTSFPYTSPSFAYLQILDLSHNYVAEFDGVFPSMYALYLNNNSFTSVPSGVYKLSNLKILHIAGNPFEGMPTFTSEQATFLQGLEQLDLTLDDFPESPNCGSMDVQVVHSIAVCISSDTSSSGSRSAIASDDSGSTAANVTEQNTSSSGMSTGAIVGIIVAVIALVIAIAVWWFLRRRQRNNADKSQRTVQTEGTGTGSNNYLWSDEQLRALRVDAEDIQDVKKIGSGSFGEVWLVIYRSSQMLASKRLLNRPDAAVHLQHFIEEVKLVATFDHPNIIKFKGVAWTFHNDLQALFEYMKHGDLRGYLVSHNKPEQRVWTLEKLQLASDVAEALVYVHSFSPPIVHRDLKSRNVLLTTELRAKLTDFGTARTQSEHNTMTAGVGTGLWQAPEVLDGSASYGPPADIFSFGVLLSELDSHEIPYDDAVNESGKKRTNVAVLQLIAVGELRPTFSDACPSGLRALAVQCTAQDPASRPTAVQLAYQLRKLQADPAFRRRLGRSFA